MVRRSTLPIETGHNGRRASARRPLVLAMLLLAAVALSPAVGADSQDRIEVSDREGAYQVRATFRITQPAETAMRVLTDYERIPRFMPAVRSSRVLERNGTRVIVEQAAIAKFLWFSKQVHLVLEVDEEPAALRFRDRGKKSFAVYEGSWTLEEQPGRTDVTYTLTAKPAFDVPGFVLKRLMKRDASDMIERMRTEIAANLRRRRA